MTLTLYRSRFHACLLLAGLVSGLSCPVANAAVTVIGVQYQQDQMFPEFPCIWHADCHLDTAIGCHVHVYLKNTGAGSVTITDATLAGYSLETVLATGDIVGARSIFYYWDNPPTDILNAGEPVWYKADPKTVPAGGVAQVVIRLRYIPVTQPIAVGVVTSGGTVTTNITVNAAAPQLASIGYSSDRTKVYLHWRRTNGAAPTSVWMDGTNVTANTTTVGDSSVDFASSVISLAAPFAPMSYHVYQGVYADGKIASASQRAWTNKFIYATYGNFELSANYDEADWVAEASAHGFNNVQVNVGEIGGYMFTPAGEADCRARGYGYTTGDKTKFNDIDPDMFFLNDEPDAQEDNQANTHCNTGLRIPCGSGHTTGILVMSEIAHGEELRADRPYTPTSVNMDATLKPLNYISWGQGFDVLQVDPYYQRRLSDSYWFNQFEIPLYSKATYIYAVSRVVCAAAEPNPSNVLLYSCEWKQNVNGTDMVWPFPTRESKRIEVYYSLAGGARGIGYWWMPKNYPSKGLAARTPAALALWKELGLLGNEIRMVAPLLVRSTPVSMTLTPSAKVWARSLATGPDTMILFAVNDNYTNDIVGCHYTNVNNATVTATLPSWLQSPMAFEVSSSGLKAASTQVTNGNQLQINLGTLTLTRMIVLTKDPQVPLAVQQRYDQSVRPGICTFASEFCTNSKPVVVVPPQSQIVLADSNATFVVTASGFPLPTYQWRFYGTNLSGATTATYTRANAQVAHSGGYSVVLSNSLGVVTSVVATLTVSTNGFPPDILAPPQSQSVFQGSNATFTVSAEGTGTLSYQWRFNTANISGATNTSYTRTNAQPADGGSYDVVVANGAGAVTSAVAILTVTLPCPAVSLANASFEGSNSSGVATNWTGYQRAPNPTTVWTIQAASPPSGAGVQYQQIANTSSTGGGGVRQDITGCTIGATYSIAGWFRGNSGNSTVTVKASPTASASWSTATNLYPAQTTSGSTWTSFSGVVVATGTNLTVWLDGQTGGSGQNNTACFDAVVVTCEQMPPPPPVITQQPSAQNVCAGGTATFNVAATGQGTVTYQWQTNGVNISNNSHYAGCTSAMLWVTNAGSADAVNYRCVVSDVNGSSTSSQAALTIQPVTTITQQPSSVAAVAGGTANFSVAASGGGTLAYQWQQNSDNLSDAGHFSGVTTPSLTITGADTNDVASYRCVVTGDCSTTNSSSATLTITACANPTLSNADFEGGTNEFGVANGWTGYQREPNPTTTWSIKTASPPDTGLQYQQIVNTSSTGGGGIRQDVTGCTVGATYSIAGWMRGNSLSATCTVKCSLAASTDWSTAIDLNPPQTITGNYWVTFSGTVVATGPTMTLWLDGQTGGAGLNKAECFDAVTVTCLGGPAPTITQQPSATNICSGVTATFTVAATGTGTLTYQWQKNQANLANGGHYSGVTSDTLNVTGADSGDVANYRCVVTDDNGNSSSEEAALSLKAATTITQQPSATNMCAGVSVASFSVSATGDGTLTYQWQKADNPQPSTFYNLTDGWPYPYSGATTATLTITGALETDAGDYRCVVTGGCGSATSSAASLTVSFTSVDITGQPSPQNVCPGSNATFHVTVTQDGTGPVYYYWEKNGVSLDNAGHYSGVYTATLTVSNADNNDVANYRCWVNGYCSDMVFGSSVAALTLKAPTSITQQPIAQSIRAGSNATFSVTASGDGTLSYQWQTNSVNIGNNSHYSGCTTATLTVANVGAADAVNYRCVVTGGCGSATSSPAALTLKTLPFILEGPGVNPADFQVTVFATGLTNPMGMARLSDGSFLVTESQGANFFSAAGRLLRFTDADQNGVADGAGAVLYSGLPSAPTAVCVASNLVLVTGSGKPVTVLRAGATPSSALSLVGQFGFAYPSPPNWGHQNTSLTVRKATGFTNRFHVLFQIGSQFNYDPTTNTVTLTNNNISGATGTLLGDSLYQLTLIDDGVNVAATNVVRLASGLRQAAGHTIHPRTGDVYFQENGIDGFGTITNREAFSADELNFIARTNLGGPVEYFGFPSNYVAYRANTQHVVGLGVQPLIAFQPIPDPYTGAESEGANQIAFAPPGFPPGLNQGVFLGFHGQFSWGGTNNEENPLVFANPATAEYFHFIRGQQEGIGHFDGLLATEDSLFVADCGTNGDLSFGAGRGVIYQIKSLVAPPAITQQPAAIPQGGICPGFNVTFTVAATGTGTSRYEWQTNDVTISDGNHYSGTTNATLTVSNVSSADVVDYRCVVSDDNGDTYSVEAALTLAATTITQQPSATNVCPGATATFTITTTGNGALTYQWQTNGVNLGNDSHYSGATTATLTITNAGGTDAVNYRCVVTGDCGSSVTSSAPALTLKAATLITQQPSGTNVCPGATATFIVAATGEGTVTYQWQTNGVNVSDGDHYSGCATATLTITNAGNADEVNYRCIVTGGCGSIASSESALMLVGTTITQQPVAQTVALGSNATFTVTATGDGNLTYQWQKNAANLSNGGHYSGVTTANLTITGTDSSDVANYACVVTGNCGSVTSAPAALSLTGTNVFTFSVNRAVPDGSSVGIFDTRTISTPVATVTDLKVRLKISGTYNGDLFCYVAHGSGYSVLLNRVGRTAGNGFGYDDPGLDVTFDGAAGNDVHVYRLTVTGNHNTGLGTNVMGTWVADGRTNRPDQVLDTDARPALLNAFTNLDPNGTWTIFVADLAGGDAHTLVSWGLEITGPEAAPATGTIYGKVQLQGFTGTNRTVRLVASDGAGAGLQTNDVSLNFAGSPKVADYVLSVPTNTVYVSAKTAWNLRRRQAVVFNNFVATNNFTGSGGQLLGGDISQNNNLVNTADYTVLKGNWLKSTAGADLTGDGLVNTADYTILKGNWLKPGDLP